MSFSAREPTPIFLFSLPRSGSTFVQRVLGRHPAIATASEPWVLLPFLYSMREDGGYAEYGHHLAASAIRDFYNLFEGGQETYLAEIRQMVLRLYTRTSSYDGQPYFLDKTPRYHLIADDIIRLFPEGKFLFLWRNPLAIMASIVHSWGQGRWNLFKYHVDLFTGIRHLVTAYQRHTSKVISVRYEDLLTAGEGAWGSVFAYLDLPFEADLLTQFQETILNGRFGDTSGLRQYQSSSTEPLRKWRKTMANPLRRRKGRQYLQWIGEERLAVMGYNLDNMLADIDEAPMTFRHVLSDLFRMNYGRFYRYLEPQILQRKIRRWTDSKEGQRHNQERLTT